MSITQILKLAASWSQMQDMLIACKTSSDNMSQLSPLDLYEELKVKRLREGAFRTESLRCYVFMTTQGEAAGRCFPFILNQDFSGGIWKAWHVSPEDEGS